MSSFWKLWCSKFTRPAAPYVLFPLALPVFCIVGVLCVLIELSACLTATLQEFFNE